MKPCTPDEFTPAQIGLGTARRVISVTEQADLANQFLAWLHSGCQPDQYTPELHQAVRASIHFGMLWDFHEFADCWLNSDNSRGILRGLILDDLQRSWRNIILPQFRQVIIGRLADNPLPR